MSCHRPSVTENEILHDRNMGNKTKGKKKYTRQPIILTENDVSHSVGILDDVDLMELY